MFPFHGVHQKKISVPVLILTLLFSALAGAVLIKLAACVGEPTVSLQSPENKVYTQNSVPMDFTVDLTVTYYPLEEYSVELVFEYSLDYSPLKVLTGVQQSISDGIAICKSTLNGLSEGLHTLRVQVTAIFRRGTSVRWTPPGLSELVAFTVNTTAPQVSILSPAQLKTYNTTTLPLEFTVSEPAASLSYGLDGGAYVPIAGNTSLSGLSEGKHTIIVQAEDTAGSVGESSVTFTVETAGTEQPAGSQPAPFPTVWVSAAIIASAAVISLLGWWLTS
jgi:hypothetical protein